MRNVWTIASRELKSYFASPIAYILLTIFAIIFGFFSYSGIAIFVQYASQIQPGMQAPPMNVDQFIIQPALSNFGVILLFLSPMITMRLFAEEKRSGTIELLLTSPVHDFEIIIGKWLAAMLLFACMLAISMLNLAVVFLLSTPDWKALAVGYLGLLLMGGMLLSIGAFLSTLTKNQIVAGALGFGVVLMLWVLNWVDSYNTTTVGKVCGYLAITTHFEQFAKGVIELKDAVYYLSAIGLGLFLSKRSIESLRWRA